MHGTEKTCSACGKLKPLGEFHKAILGALGRASKCKHCRSDEARSRYAKKRVSIIRQHREYREKNADLLREKAHLRYLRPGAADSIKARQRELRAKDPDRFRARFAVAKALRTGQLSKPSACEWCGLTAPRLVGHHHSYAPECWLDVTFVCDRCHGRHHGEKAA